MAVTGFTRLSFRLLLQLRRPQYLTCLSWEHPATTLLTQTLRPRDVEELISKAFTHFWGKAGITRKSTFKSLRKTYVTELTKSIGKKALFVKHSSIMTAIKHYLGQEALTEATKNVRFLKEDRGINLTYHLNV
jgi:lipoate-protein ligase B